MASPDRARAFAICDLLLGAAHADSHFHDRERQRVRELVAELAGKSGLPPELDERIGAFRTATFDLERSAAAFRGDAIEEKRKLIRLVAAIHDADEELDLAEDDYLRALAAALGLPDSELTGLALELEVEELRDSYARLRAMPPPIPGAGRAASAGNGAVDVDLDD